MATHYCIGWSAWQQFHEEKLFPVYVQTSNWISKFYGSSSWSGSSGSPFGISIDERHSPCKFTGWVRTGQHSASCSTSGKRHLLSKAFVFPNTIAKKLWILHMTKCDSSVTFQVFHVLSVQTYQQSSFETKTWQVEHCRVDAVFHPTPHPSSVIHSWQPSSSNWL